MEAATRYRNPEAPRAVFVGPASGGRRGVITETHPSRRPGRRRCFDLQSLVQNPDRRGAGPLTQSGSRSYLRIALILTVMVRITTIRSRSRRWFLIVVSCLKTASRPILGAVTFFDQTRKEAVTSCRIRAWWGLDPDAIELPDDSVKPGEVRPYRFSMFHRNGNGASSTPARVLRNARRPISCPAGM
jgi:hypothetical protein